MAIGTALALFEEENNSVNYDEFIKRYADIISKKSDAEIEKN